MNAVNPETPVRDVAVVIEQLVGVPGKATRTSRGREDHRALAMSDVDCQLIRCPTIGGPLWLLIAGSRWIRTSPVASIELDERAGLAIIVCTHDARYHLVF